MYEYADNKHACPTNVKDIVNGPVGQVLAGPLFLKVKVTNVKSK